jgi:diguanylate cyclase (GGDEF)-like protein/PAS domain S-box-containing protein
VPDSPAHDASAAADLERLCALTSDLLLIADERGVILHVNAAWESALGWPREHLIGRSFLGFVHPDDAEASAALLGPESRRDGIVDFENRYATRSGAWRTLCWRAHVHEGRWFAVAEDVSRRRKLERDVLHDPLTGLLNRAALFDRLAHALARAAREDRPLGVLFLDLDGFKGVNDALGHAIGDRVLAVAAQRLDAAVRRSDTVARLGGDEFVVLAEDTGEEVVGALVERVRAALAEPMPAGDGAVTLGASIGVVLARGGHAADVLREADVAMYRAKSQGRNRAVWFDAALRGEVAERLGLASELRGARDRDELRVFFQPLVSVADEAVVGCEALVRWEHPERGLLGPDRFLPIAEADGDIVEIGTWVLEQACRQQRRWRRDAQDLSVSVNVSARELADASYADRVARVLHATGVDPVAVVLEVTETALLRDLDGAARTLTALKHVGVRIALDDFGRGYSSLEHVKALPVDVLKVDRAFVAGIDEDDEDRAIVAAVHALGREAGLTVIAEGVETMSQLACLRELGCPLAQGWWFGRPAPATALELDGFLPRGLPGVGDPFVIREFMRQIGIPARIR